jgi:hypothetical protein
MSHKTLYASFETNCDTTSRHFVTIQEVTPSRSANSFTRFKVQGRGLIQHCFRHPLVAPISGTFRMEPPEVTASHPVTVRQPITLRSHTTPPCHRVTPVPELLLVASIMVMHPAVTSKGKQALTWTKLRNSEVYLRQNKPLASTPKVLEHFEFISDFRFRSYLYQKFSAMLRSFRHYRFYVQSISGRHAYLDSIIYSRGPFQWPSGLRRRSTADRLLVLLVRIPTAADMSVCWQIQVSDTDRSLVQRNPTDCGVFN